MTVTCIISVGRMSFSWTPLTRNVFYFRVLDLIIVDQTTLITYRC